MSSIQSIIEGSIEKAGYNSLVGLIMLVVAFVPLGTSLLAVCLSQAVLKQQSGIHANKRLATPLDELQSRLREALLVDRAVRLRTSAISFSLSWACLCLSCSSLESRDGTLEPPYNATDWDFKQSRTDFLSKIDPDGLLKPILDPYLKKD